MSAVASAYGLPDAGLATYTDMVAVVEAPDDAVLARFALMLGAGGNLRTQTLKAFPETAYREIIASLV